jgi:5-methylcytosine-specific restriction endonuclease McrA
MLECISMDAKQQKTLRKFEAGLLKSPATIRRILISLHGYRCMSCSLGEWYGVRLPLEMDHIDGHHDNNLPSNLRLLCPNCHSITPTWKGKNKGKGRPKRRQSSMFDIDLDDPLWDHSFNA